MLAHAAAHGIAWDEAREILRFAETGERPRWNSGKRAGKRSSTGGNITAKYVQIADEVAQLRHEKKLPFTRIAARLGVAASTVRRAYDHACPEAARAAAECGKTPNRGRYSHLGEDLFREIRRLLSAGGKTEDIAAQVGCGKSTVGRVRQQMQAETGKDQAAKSGAR